MTKKKQPVYGDSPKTSGRFKRRGKFWGGGSKEK